MDLPPGKDAIGLKWVYKSKFNSDGSLQKHKAHLVVKGYAQVLGIDFFEPFSPVARIDTIRTIIAIAAQRGWKVSQFDVKSAFLNGELQEEVYVEQPHGFEIEGLENKVYKLGKALYGLKQAPRAWYGKIDKYFLDNRFQRSESEPTLYVKSKDTDEILIVCLYVDDMIFTGNSLPLINDFKEKMMSKFEMTDLGILHYFLGMEIIQDPYDIFLCQEKYAKDLLKRFHMSNCNPASTPMNTNERLVLDDGLEKADEKEFRSIVGGLIYLTHSRLDIMFAVSLISRFMHKPSRQHMGAAKRVLRYIRGTLSFGLRYQKVSNCKLISYTDSDWAGCAYDRKSTSGYAHSLGSGVISWASKKQQTIALSSSEAEYMAATSAACQTVWLRRILADLKEKQDEATIMFCDNKSTIAIDKEFSVSWKDQAYRDLSSFHS